MEGNQRLFYEDGDHVVNDTNTGISVYGGDDLMQMIQLTAINVNGVSQQMGLVANKLSAHESRFNALEDRMSRHEHTETITSNQARRLHDALHQRCYQLLGVVWKDGVVVEGLEAKELYLSDAIRKAWSDAKRYSKVEHNYRDTLKVDFDDCMEYINSWHPEMAGGIEGLKKQVDRRRETRRQLGIV